MRGVTHGTPSGNVELKFQLTRLMRGVTMSIAFIRLLCMTFQLTRLMRGVTNEKSAQIESSINFNSHASCEA